VITIPPGGGNTNAVMTEFLITDSVCNVEGDAYRYTIQPIFRDVSHDARCHIRRRRLDVLYELFFFIQLPRRSPANHADAQDQPLFQTPKVYRTVWSGGIADDPELYRSRGRYEADYLTVEHDAGLALADELVLRRRTGSSVTGNASRRKQGGPAGAAAAARRRTLPSVFSVQQLNRISDDDVDDDDAIAVHEISRNIFVASTQFERPFDYSTSTWSEAPYIHFFSLVALFVSSLPLAQLGSVVVKALDS